jgi:hypothetical protein
MKFTPLCLLEIESDSGVFAAAYSVCVKLSALMTYFLRNCGLVRSQDQKAIKEERDIIAC